jgi:hypothetical protein
MNTQSREHKSRGKKELRVARSHKEVKALEERFSNHLKDIIESLSISLPFKNFKMRVAQKA